MADPLENIDWSKQIPIGLWVAQAVLASFCLVVAWPLLVHPSTAPAELGVGVGRDLPGWAALALGLVQLGLALALVLPGLLRRWGLLTPLAAAALMALQVVLLVADGMRGDLQLSFSVHCMLIALAGFVVWGRGWYAPLPGRR